MKLKFRCPSCAKLYEVADSDIKNEKPLFKCLSCENVFGFNFPPCPEEGIQCFLVNKNSNGEFHLSEVSAAQQQDPFKSCPKCGALNEAQTDECYSCRVIFNRLVGLPEDKTLNAQPSLVKKWSTLISNFDDESLHDDFILSCHRLDALGFATLKYEEIRLAQGGDVKCDMMLARINSLSLVGLSQKPVATSMAEARNQWRPLIFWGPFGLSAFLILLGISNAGHRNLIGAGVALSVMAAGLIMMVKGRISPMDFKD